MQLLLCRLLQMPLQRLQMPLHQKQKQIAPPKLRPMQLKRHNLLLQQGAPEHLQQRAQLMLPQFAQQLMRKPLLAQQRLQQRPPMQQRSR
jgi:hypothetical protein